MNYCYRNQWIIGYCYSHNMFLLLFQKKRAHSGVYLESVHPHQVTASIKGVERGKKKNQQATVMIEIILRKYPQETCERLKKEYIRASEDMTIERLKMFLEKKICHTPHTDFQVCGCNRVH